MTHSAKFNRVRAGVACFCLLVTSVSVADSMANGRDLIEKMSRATQGLNYTGSFVFAHGGEIESMQIYHSNSGGIEREKLVSLSGEAREIIRNAENVVCIWPGSKSVVVSKSTPRTPFPDFAPDQLAQLEELYEFARKGEDRVAGRKAEVVYIKPHDNHRYGYTLWIDAENYLMLRSVMSDQQGAVIEQVMFTQIDFVDSIPRATFLPSVAGERQEWSLDLDPEEPVLVETPADDMPGIGNYEAPDGFALVSSKIMALPEGTVVRRAMFSDGLASLSVYIARTGKDQQNELQGASGMGAVHAYGVKQGNWHVTVVGEVPRSTVKMMGDSLTLANK